VLEAEGVLIALQALGWPSFGVVAALVFIVRPIYVFVSNEGTVVLPGSPDCR